MDSTSAVSPLIKAEAHWEEIGPARAEELLNTYNIDYRKFRPRYAEGLARDMEEGHWNFDGSPIRVDVNNDLFDGQHRLRAVIISQTRQVFLVITGLPVEAYNTTDTGLARNFGDSLRRRGYNNVTLRSALVKLIARWEDNRSLDSTTRYTHAELDEVHDRYVAEISRAVSLTSSTSKKMDMPSAITSFCWWVLSRIDEVEAKEFLLAVAEGEMINRTMPAYVLRERLRKDKAEIYSRSEYAHLVFSAWNAHRENRSIGRLVFPSGVVTRENMEKPQ